MSRSHQDCLVRALFPLILAIASTWPLARHPSTEIALGPYHSTTVTLTTEWTLAWNARSFSQGLRDYWNAPIFAPEKGTLALSEPQPLSGALFWLPWRISGSLELAYACVLLLTLALNGWMAERFLRRGGLAPVASIAGGAMTTLLPFVHTELGVLPFITLAGALAALEAWLWFLERPSVLRATALGGAIGASYLLSCQLTLLFVVILALAAPFSVSRTHLRANVAGALAAGAVVCALVVAPLVTKQLAVTSEYHLQRSTETVRDLSAGINRYIRPPFPEVLPMGPPTKAGSSPRRWFYPGTVKLLLAGAGVYFALRKSTIARLSLAFTVAAFLVGLGPLLHVGPVSLYAALARIVPGFRQIRGLFHAAAFVQLGVVCLASVGVDALLGRCPAWFAPRWQPVKRRAGWLATCGVLSALAVVELWPRGQRFATPASLEANARWIDFVRRTTRPSDIVAFAPFPASGKVDAFEPTAEWMRLGLRLERPMVNGYSSYFPDSNRRLSRAMKQFPDPASIDALRAAGVTTLLVARERYTGPPPPLPRLLADEVAGMDVYALTQSASGPVE